MADTLRVYRYTRRAPATSALTPVGERPFTRDRATVLAYTALGCYTFWLYAFGPAVTLLRAELGFSYAVLGTYSVLWSLGAATAGLCFGPIARHLARGTLLWASALTCVLAAALFSLGRGLPPTLTAAAVLGLAGTTLLAALQAILSDRHGALRDRALSEANVAAGASAVAAPLVLGALAAGAWGWRPAFALPAAVLAALWVRHRHLHLTGGRHDPQARRGGRLPPACWTFALLMATSSAIEFCVVYFGPQALVAVGLSPAAAGTALGGHYLGILAGRVIGARLARRPARTPIVLRLSLLVTAVGFGAFWSTDRPAVAVAGLAACGLGVANLYPLALALTLDAARGREDRANARSQLLVGLVSAAAPLTLGTLADQHGLTTAFVVEPVLIVAALLLLQAGLRTNRRAATG